MAPKQQPGRIHQERADRFTDAEIERQAKEDGEDEFFDRDAAPDRVEQPYPRKRPEPVR
jgi:hypothetical protein